MQLNRSFLGGKEISERINSIKSKTRKPRIMDIRSRTEYFDQTKQMILHFTVSFFIQQLESLVLLPK